MQKLGRLDESLHFISIASDIDQNAEVPLNKAIKLYATFPEPFLNLGTVLKHIGKLIQAILVTQKAIDLLLSFPEAHYNLGNLLNDQGSLELSEKSFLKTID